MRLADPLYASHVFRIAPAMVSIVHFPPHVWANVLRDECPRQVFRVGHACRALHARIMGHARCECHRKMIHQHADQGALSAFWIHWRIDTSTMARDFNRDARRWP